jgi:hypothetical protein
MKLKISFSEFFAKTEPSNVGILQRDVYACRFYHSELMVMVCKTGNLKSCSGYVVFMTSLVL